MLYTSPSGARSDFEAYARAAAASEIARIISAPAAGVPSVSTTVTIQTGELEQARWASLMSVYRLSYEQLRLARQTTTPAASGVSEPHREDDEFSKTLAF